MNRRTWLAVAAGGPLAGALLARRIQRVTQRRLGGFRASYFPNVPLRTHENTAVRFYEDLLRDKLVAITFMYATCEGICPSVTTNLAHLQRLLGERVGRDIFLYSITLKPSQDTPDVLLEYARVHGAGPGWLFLTGRPPDIELLRRRLGAVDVDPAVDADASSHTGLIRYGHEPTERWAACPALAKPAWIARSILSLTSDHSPAKLPTRSTSA